METDVSLSVSDAGELLTLQRAAYVTEGQAHHDLRLPPLIQSLDELTTELSDPSVVAFGLRDSRWRLVAAVRVNIDCAKEIAVLGRLVVAPDLQGRGLGSRLLELVEQRLSTEVVELQLFTGEHSAGNLRLYARFGYRETHRTLTPGGYALVHLSKPLR
ncbi:GNAT family N-acetyltransferase [Gordonia sp. DT30]|uniref:GNAT family N-acetyltransferase n=1 Tax=unclassified Gordonia (in: high G+C Gram-positive bacteria) TaxID=2657482 RepID=UPI003CE8B86B